LENYLSVPTLGSKGRPAPAERDFGPKKGDDTLKEDLPLGDEPGVRRSAGNLFLLNGFTAHAQLLHANSEIRSLPLCQLRCIR